METEPTQDHQMSEETLILEGLRKAVWAGRITEDEKAEWLSEFIDRRNATAERLANERRHS